MRYSLSLIFVLKQFAIRPNLRNHKIMTRDSVIKLVASAVGPGHAVDLKDYDLLILVEVYKVRDVPNLTRCSPK